MISSPPMHRRRPSRHNHFGSVLPSHPGPPALPWSRPRWFSTWRLVFDALFAIPASPTSRNPGSSSTTYSITMPYTLPSLPAATAVSYPPSLALKGGLVFSSSSSPPPVSPSPTQRPLGSPRRQKSTKTSTPTLDSDLPQTSEKLHQEHSSSHNSARVSALLSTPVPPPLRPEFAAVTVEASIPFPSITRSAERHCVGPCSEVTRPAERLSSTAPVLSSRRLLKSGASIHRGANLHIDFGSVLDNASPAQSDKSPTNRAQNAITIPPIPNEPKHSRTQSTQRASYVRKKSGELVKPALKPQSASMFITPSPATSSSGSSRRRENLRISLDGLSFRSGSRSEPTTPSSPKVVHFDTNLEQVKHFLAEQRPLAVSRDHSPTETSEGEDSFNYGNRSSEDENVRQALEIQLVNAPPKSALEHLTETWDRDHVRLQRLSLSDDARFVRGLVIVRNLAFAKCVAARFTMDRWQTTSEVTARYVGSLQDGAYDQFEFNIRLIDYLSKIWEKTLHLAIRYSCEGHAESWDSNGGQNYIVVFRRKNTKKTPVAQDTDDEDEDEDHIRVKMTALRKSLEHVMHFPPRPVVNPRTNPVQNLVASPMSTPPFVNSRSAADVILRVGKQNSPINTPASSPPRRAFLLGDANVIKREGTLAGRYDLESSLQSSSSSSATSYFPQGRMHPLPTAIAYASRTPEISGKSQEFVPSPISLHGLLIPRGSPRDAPDVPSHDGSLRLRFRTSSDGDIPSSSQSAIAGPFVPYEPSLSSSTIDVPYGRNNQPAFFSIGGPSPISRDDSPQHIVRSPASPPLLANNMATNLPSSRTTHRPSTLQESRFHLFPPSMVSTASNAHLNPGFVWGTALASNTSSSEVPSQGEDREGLTGPPTTLFALQVDSKINVDLGSSSSTTSTTSGSSEQSSSVSSPTASAGLPLGVRLEDLSSDADTRASTSISACPGEEHRDDTEMGTLRTFIDQFCFSTGSDVDLASRQSHSVSDASEITSGGSTPIPSTIQ